MRASVGDVLLRSTIGGCPTGGRSGSPSCRRWRAHHPRYEMTPGTRRRLTLGAASVIAATTMLAGTATAQDEVPQGGTIVVGEWQAATQLNTFMSNALRDQEAAWIISRPLVIVDDQGNYIPEFLTE